MNELFFLGVIFAAALISAAVGFGSGLIAVTFGALFLDIKTTIILTSFSSLFVAVTKAWWFRQHIDWRVFKSLLLAPPLAIFGTYLMLAAPVALIEKSLGGVVITYLLLNWGWPDHKFRLGAHGTVLGGAIYGFVSGFVGTGNAVKAMIIDNLGLRKEMFLGTMAITSCLVLAAKIPLYIANFEMAQNYPLILAVILAGMAGVWCGKNLIKRLTSAWARRLVMGMLLVVALRLLLF